MCNHYEQKSDVIAWAAGIAAQGNWAVKTQGDMVHPDDLMTHTWPKALAPILLATEDGCTVARIRWGVRVEIRGTTKPLVKFVTNARDDKLTGYTWRYAVAERRCLIPAVAYYEPGTGPEGSRGELRFTLKNRPMFFFAGLWDHDPDGITRAFTMVTTSPNDYASRFHDRMPVVLSDADALAWLGNKPLAVEQIRALCRPAPNDIMQHVEIAAQPKTKKITKSDLSDGELKLE